MGQAQGVVTTVTSAGILTATKDGARKFRFTGTTTHTLILPLMDLGTEYVVFNKSTGAISVTDSANVVITSVAPNSVVRITIVDSAVAGTWIVG